MPSAAQAATSCSRSTLHLLAKLSFARRANGVFECQPPLKCKLAQVLARGLARSKAQRPVRPSRQQVVSQQRIPGSPRNHRTGEAQTPILHRIKPLSILPRRGVMLITRHQERSS